MIAWVVLPKPSLAYFIDKRGKITLNMPVPEFLNDFDPETCIVNPNLPKDKMGDPYLPVIHPVAAKKTPTDHLQPGKCVMTHVAEEKGPLTLSRQVKSMLDEGVISPRRYAIFSGSPTFTWGDSDLPATQVVCRSPYRWSREDMDNGDKNVSPWFEGMIGLTVAEAARIAPKGTAFWLEDKHRKKLIIDTGVFSYVPPTHIIGLIGLTDQTHGAYKDSVKTLRIGLLTGTKPEEDCVDDFVQDNITTVKIDAMTPETKESLLQALAAAYTQNGLLIEIKRQFNESPKYDLRRVRPSFPWTTKLLETAIRSLSTVELWKYNSDLIPQIGRTL